MTEQNMRTIPIKMKTIKIGWRRFVVNRRGKKMVYCAWCKPPKLMADYTIVWGQPDVVQYGTEVLEVLNDVYQDSILNP